MPEFFRVERGLTLGKAASLASVLPFSAIFAAAAGGVATAMVGLRRPFLRPMAVLSAIGCAGAVLLPSVRGMRAALGLIGIGSAGGLAATATLIMELPGMTPAKMCTAFAFMWAVGYAGAFISPFLGGALAPVLRRYLGDAIFSEDIEAQAAASILHGNALDYREPSPCRHDARELETRRLV